MSPSVSAGASAGRARLGGGEQAPAPGQLGGLAGERHVPEAVGRRTDRGEDVRGTLPLAGRQERLGEAQGDVQRLVGPVEVPQRLVRPLPVGDGRRAPPAQQLGAQQFRVPVPHRHGRGDRAGSRADAVEDGLAARVGGGQAARRGLQARGGDEERPRVAVHVGREGFAQGLVEESASGGGVACLGREADAEREQREAALRGVAVGPGEGAQRVVRLARRRRVARAQREAAAREGR
ncbi:hypothetical protein ACIP5N_23195 [Streptomyces sp. NPDC088768]|uniref:hypothetical protein n=1 Tax=Streptomyces sp. NPDC088768 TaxID=3365894 RepID=UPI0037FCBBA9